MLEDANSLDGAHLFFCDWQDAFLIFIKGILRILRAVLKSFRKQTAAYANLSEIPRLLLASVAEHCQLL